VTGPGKPAIVLDEVRFSYDSGPNVLNGVSFEVGKGIGLGIVGPSGCGKSTLLSLLAGIAEPTSGSVACNVDESAKDRHPMSMVFQKDTVLPWLTAAENIGLGFRFLASKVAKSEQGDRIAQLIEWAGLQGFEKHYPYQLSGGMRRRVAFLAAVAVMPQILLLDEPFSSLDEPSRVAIHDVVFQIMKRIGTTMVLVTHDLAEAISLCDRVVILSNRPTSVFHEYSIPFGDDRKMLELRQAEPFLELYGRLWHDLSLQIQRASSSGDPE
jgi:ABC-type nitrate/sulfonate/bicarbonate transport system ATPase subunit